MTQDTSAAADAEFSRRDRIIDAARAVLREDPEATISMGEVADRAGVARPNLYRYFSNKDELIKEVLLSDVRAIHESRRTALASVASAKGKIVESLVMGARGTLRSDTVTAFHGLAKDAVAALVSGDRDLLELEAEYWRPILREARDEGVLVEDLTDERIMRWFMTSQYIIATQPALVGEDFRAWIEDFVAAAVLHLPNTCEK